MLGPEQAAQQATLPQPERVHLQVCLLSGYIMAARLLHVHAFLRCGTD